ncbi:peptidase family C54-domain-containing protein [Mycena sanguinolenta]|nr:peptidase family C54-domain-containing protein [Mycena sanguinolenta]
MLVDALPICGLGVSVATDGTLYQTEVFAASHSPSSPTFLSAASSASSSHGGHGSSFAHRGPSSSHRHARARESQGKGETLVVLLLLGIRLGLDGVNPIYYETVKCLYTFPQSVRIAGGRPSSWYYFVGMQGDGLFYLDPHHSRAAAAVRGRGESAILRRCHVTFVVLAWTHRHRPRTAMDTHTSDARSAQQLCARQVDEPRVRVGIELCARGVNDPGALVCARARGVNESRVRPRARRHDRGRARHVRAPYVYHA